MVTGLSSLTFRATGRLRHDGRGPRRRSLGERLDVYAKVFRLRDY
jgi:hypothetical protein